MSGKKIVLTGLSGCGKSFFTNSVRKNLREIKPILSVTTRKPRSEEVDGIDKLFVTKQKFQELTGQLCMINTVYDNMYAYYKDEICADEIGILDLHYKGLDSMRKLNENTVVIYIRPVTLEMLRQKLTVRDGISPEIQSRINCLEIEHQHLEKMYREGDFDYLFVNKYTDESNEDFLRLIRDIVS